MTDQNKTLRAFLLASTATGLALASPSVAQEDALEAPLNEVEEIELDDDDDIDVGEGRPPEYDDTIVVTGYRASVERSLDLKRNSSAIVEAISAEDIGKLPDVSIAESLGRLPGLAAQRLRGRAQVISVRGLGPDFTYTLLNGREQVTAGDNRGVEFDQYPRGAPLLRRGLQDPDSQPDRPGPCRHGGPPHHPPAGLRPTTDHRQRARYEYNDLDVGSGSEDGYRFTGFYVDQFLDDTLGFVVGFAAQSSPTQAERFEAWGYPRAGTDAFEIGDDITDDDEDGLPDNGVGVLPGRPFVLGGAKPYVEARDLERELDHRHVAVRAERRFQSDHRRVLLRVRGRGVSCAASSCRCSGVGAAWSAAPSRSTRPSAKGG